MDFRLFPSYSGNSILSKTINYIGILFWNYWFLILKNEWKKVMDFKSEIIYNSRLQECYMQYQDKD